MAHRREEVFRGTDRFELRRRLGSGAFGVVYEALDRERNSIVALKTLHRAGEEALYRLKQEFRSLADLAHPNLVALYELLSDGEQWFFTMELVEGKTFYDFVREDKQDPVGGAEWESNRVDSLRDTETFDLLDLAGLASGSPEIGESARPARFNSARLRSALGQAAAGVCALHSAGKLHRDIKSSNVLVTSSGRVVLLDFGLVTEVGSQPLDQSVAIAGTPLYMSPEQSLGQPVSEASDWYSLGVMLYEALTGRAPFVGSPAEMVLQKQLGELRAPREILDTVPEDLDALCRELLHRDPKLRPKGDDILRRLGAGAPLPMSGSAAASDLRRAPFIGRDAHLAVLMDAFRTTEKGEAVTVTLHGGSGMGKSALVRRFLETLRATDNVVVLAGRCFERESVPYKALDSLMDVLSHYLKALPASRAEPLMPRDILALARLFPVLRRAEAVASARRRVLEIPDVHELRRRAFQAFRELMERLAEERPLILFIDDLHWGDVDSAALLEELTRPPEPPALLLILAYRTEEAGTSALLRRLLPKLVSGSCREIRVDPLPPVEARDLARALLGSFEAASDRVIDTIARESSGNPFFLSELARSVNREGEQAIASGNGSDEKAITLDRVIQDRVSRLSESARRFLEIVAVAGRPVDFSVAKRAADPDPRENVLAVLRVGHLIRTRGSGSREELETYHDRIREAVVAGLAAEDLKAHHRRLAEALEASGLADPEWLALHWREAGEAERASEYAIAAARRAAETLAFERAARLFALALELSAGSESQDRDALRVELGDALSNAGRGAEAASSYLEASQRARSADALELQRKAAEQLLRAGHVDQGVPVLRSVLGRVGFQYVETKFGSILSFLFHRLRIRIRGLAFHEREAAKIPAEELIRIDTCWSVSFGLSMIDTIRGRDFQARHLLLALKAGEPYRVARAIATEAGYSATGGPPNARRTADLVERATVLAARVGHPQAIGIAQVAIGITALAEGRWKTAWDLAEKGSTILRERCTGVAWELDTTHIYSLRALFYLGEVAELGSRLPALLRDARERDDLFAETSLRVRHGYVARLLSDDPESAREELRDAIARWTTQAFHMQHYFALVAEADLALYAGEPAAALDIVAEKSAALRRSRLLRVHHLRIEWLHLRARSAIAAAVSRSGDRDRLLRQASADARRIEKEGVHWGDGLAALLKAGVASVRGDREEAAERLAFAEVMFDGADMALYSAAARFRRAAVLAGEDAKTCAESAAAWMQKQTIENPAGFVRMLAPGRWEGAP